MDLFENREVFRWTVFHIFIAFLLILDLGVFHKKRRVIKLKEAVLWSFFWVVLSLCFNTYIYLVEGSEKALEFFTGYLVEKSLSVDNIFIFLVVFSFFKVPLVDQRRVLYLGIIAAFILRLSLILIGAALLESFEWVKYLFGLFIAFTGFKLVVQKEGDYNPEKNLLIRWAKKRFRITEAYHAGRYFIVKKGVLYATPLFLVLLVIESSDLIFALDSVPAILAITTDRFIVYTSNVFAILGLRSLYFVVAQFIEMFRYLKVGLGGVLLYIGIKMGISSIYPIPLGYSLLVIVTILAASMVYSIKKKE